MSSSSSTHNSLEDYTMVPCGGKVQRVSKGLRFCPIDRDVVKHYLKNKAFGLQLPCDIIQEIDFFSTDPDQLPLRELKYGRESEAYFFAYSSTISNRATSKGYWKESGEDVLAFHEKEATGSKKTMVFYWGKSPDGQISNYIMQEYRLNQSLNTDDSTVKNNVENLVLCRIRVRSPKNSLVPQELLLEDEAYSSDEEEME